jgi:tetratricopeptide (TPR) repeat protein
VSEALEAAGIGRPEEAVGGQGHWELRPVDVVIEERDGQLKAFRTGVRRRMLSAAALITPSDRLAPALVGFFEHEDAIVRATALELLSEGTNVDISAPVVALLKRETARPVIAAAAVVLARVGTAYASEILVDLVARGALSPGSVRSAFGRLEQPEKVDALLCERAERERGEACAALVFALAVVRRRQATLASGTPTLHDRSRAMLVETALADADDAARQSAAEALRWSAGDPGMAELLDALDAHEPMRRARAARALGVLQDDSAASTLAEALEREDDPQTRLEIAASLVELRADEALATATRVLVELMLWGDAALSRSAREVLDRRRDAGVDPVLDYVAALADSESDDELERAVARYLESLDGIALTGALCLWLRGDSRARRGLYEEALSDYDAAVEHGGIVEVHSYRANALAALGRHMDALSAQSLAVEGEPEDAGNQALLGRYAYEAGELDLSIASRLKALALARSLPDDERNAVVDEVRRDLDALRARRPEPTATVDTQLHEMSEVGG